MSVHFDKSIDNRLAAIEGHVRAVRQMMAEDKSCEDILLQISAIEGSLNKLGKIAADRGFKLCFHHHMGTVVQTSEETDRMMANTDPRYVFLCYDTGHFTFAGEDPLAMLKKYVDRVGHVHLKDMRLPVVEEARKNNWSFLQSVRNGAFTVPGDGNVDFDPVFKVLSDAGYQGWLLVEAEQDPATANPLEYAIKGRTYIREHTGR